MSRHLTSPYYFYRWYLTCEDGNEALADHLTEPRLESHVRRQIAAGVGGSLHRSTYEAPRITPKTQGKIERVLLNNYYLPDDLKGQICALVDH